MSMGFAILSDIEAFFFIQAAQGDQRTNMLQAPKVTLFNGQSAIVADTTQRPFVISVIPVVGDFAAAQQPVIVVLQRRHVPQRAGASSRTDRRFVRLTVVPFFSQIGEVNTFTLRGSVSHDQPGEQLDRQRPDERRDQRQRERPTRDTAGHDGAVADASRSSR